VASELTIRDAKGDDLGAVSALLVDAYAQYLPPPRELTADERAGWDGYRRNIADVWSRAPISSTIIAERDGKLLGSVNYYAPGRPILLTARGQTDGRRSGFWGSRRRRVALESGGHLCRSACAARAPTER
jgi:hypothetical protein